MQVLSGHCHSPLYYSVVVAAFSVHSSWWCSLSAICSRRTTAVITTILRRPSRPTVSRCHPGPGSSLLSSVIGGWTEVAATNQTEELRSRPGPRPAPAGCQACNVRCTRTLSVNHTYTHTTETTYLPHRDYRDHIETRDIQTLRLSLT